MKGKSKVKDSFPGATTAMILSLRESEQNYKEELKTCQANLEAQKSEVQKWRSSFQNVPFIPSGLKPEPVMVMNSVRSLKSAEESLREQVERGKKKEAAFIVAFAKKDKEISDLKYVVLDLQVQLKPAAIQARRLLSDPAMHQEYLRLKNLNEEKDRRLKELEENAKAVNFNSSSKKGKMLMAKCKTLQEENEKIGDLYTEEMLHELEMKLALEKSEYAEFQRKLEVLYKQMGELVHDAERAREIVSILRENIEIADNTIKTMNMKLSVPSEEEQHNQRPN
ncbi:FKBP12-interacting protein of 37 kDa [Zostera marina]|uniref:FKBP12-interacting protein of 37 kDa n=1 Tax=Zostera marina TaxID=29655 RepID=A0A0K9P7L8_ZOSMR|nr:FKBP12-interacting protein of 37 kDa [Zostera marina]